MRPILEVSIAVLLFVTGLSKILAAQQNDTLLREDDPIFSLPNQLIYLGIGTIELWIAAYLILGRTIQAKRSLVIWIITCFSIYRLGLLVGKYPDPCPCLGTGLAWFPWLSEHKNAVSLILFAVLIALGLAYFRASKIVDERPQTQPQPQA